MHSLSVLLQCSFIRLPAPTPDHVCETQRTECNRLPVWVATSPKPRSGRATVLSGACAEGDAPLSNNIETRGLVSVLLVVFQIGFSTRQHLTCQLERKLTS